MENVKGVQIATLGTACRTKARGILLGGLDPKILGLADQENVGFACQAPMRSRSPHVKDHVLIIPVEHMPNTFSLSSESEVELLRFHNSLKRYYKNQEKEAIFFEWASIRGTHANLQTIPIPSSKAVMIGKDIQFSCTKVGIQIYRKEI